MSTAKPSSVPDNEPCLCGCGGLPKGPRSRFLPGHDARWHAAKKRDAATATEATGTASEAKGGTQPRPRPSRVTEGRSDGHGAKR